MPQKDPFNGLLTVRQASKRTKLAPSVLRAAARLGAIKHHRPSGRDRIIFFTEADLDAYMAKMRKAQETS